MTLLKSINIIFALCMLLLISACGKTDTEGTITGTGNTNTEARSVGNFTSMVVNGNQTIHIIYDTQQKVEIKSYDNLRQYYITKVENGVLTVGYTDTVSIDNDNMQVYIYTPSFGKYTVNGGGPTDVTGTFYGQNCNFEINGGAGIGLTNLANNTITVLVNGDGLFHGYTATCQTLNGTVNGTGTIEMKVLGTLNGTVNGKGFIIYDGSPVVNQTVTGGGTIRHK